MIDYLQHLAADSRSFRRALEDVDPETPVPSCPGWTATDLLWHLTEVQHFWGSIVTGSLQDPAEVDALVRPDDHPSMLELFDRAATALRQTLGESDPADRVWTWSDDKTVGFVRRRQAHEALVHRVDAELVAGSIGSIDPSLAADGVDEILTVMLGALPDWGSFEPDGSTMRIECTDLPAGWGLALGRFVGTSPSSGKSYDEPAASVGLDAIEPELILRGPAPDLDLWLWGRGPIDRIQTEGDRGVASRLRDLIVEVTQ